MLFPITVIDLELKREEAARCYLICMYEVILANSAVFLTASGVNRTSKNVGKRVLIFTNCDDPAGDCDVRDRRDFHRTTIQRAKVNFGLFQNLAQTFGL